MAIEEDHNGQALFIPADNEDIVVVEDETRRFRREILGMKTDDPFSEMVKASQEK